MGYDVQGCAARVATDKLQVVGGAVVLTGREVADRLGIDDSRVRQLCIAGRFPGAMKVSNRWFIPESGLDEYLQQGRDWRVKVAPKSGGVGISALAPKS